MKNKLVAVALTALASLPTAAQNAYRCGDSYSQQPCPGGTPVLAATHEPSAADQARTREAAQRNAQAADAMEKARLKEEAKPVSAYIPPAKSEAAAAPDNPVLTKPKKPQSFTASAPAEKKAKKKVPKRKKKPAA